MHDGNEMSRRHRVGNYAFSRGGGAQRHAVRSRPAAWLGSCAIVCTRAHGRRLFVLYIFQAALGGTNVRPSHCGFTRRAAA